MEVLSKFFCEFHKVQDPIQIDVTQGRVPTCVLLREHTIRVEVGSVITQKDQSPQILSFPVPNVNSPPAQVAEQLKKRCHFHPSSVDFRVLNNPMPPQQDWFRNPNNGEPMEPDLDKVCIYHIATLHNWCSMRHFSAALRVGFTHQGLDRLYGLSKDQELFGVGGALPGAYALLTNTPPTGKDVDQVAMPISRNYANHHFISSMALVNETNLLNCIITIPTQVCEEVGFAEFRPDEKHVERIMEDRKCTREQYLAEWRINVQELQKEKVLPTHYVAIPDGHVLSWGLRDGTYAMMHLNNAHVEVFRYIPSPNNGRGLQPGVPVSLYYMINNLTFDAMVIDFRKAWFQRVDMRPLRSLYWDILPIIDPRDVPEGTTHLEGLIMARSQITYLVPPKLTQEQINGLVPVLDPTFPECTQWLPTH